MRNAIVQNRTNTPLPLAASNAAPAGRYTFVAAIAKGGMGTVELCFRRDGQSVRWVARKRLHEPLRGDPEFRTMFMDEARLAGLIRHPNVVRVSEVGEDAAGPFLIMDYVEGLSLARVARQASRARQPIPTQVAVRICGDAAAGLHAAHEVCAEDGSPLNLVHRDVSPHNVLIGFDGSVRVTDFGVAKALGNASRTSGGVLKGNMGYLSPEQLRFEEPDRRSDLFSLGVTLFELLSGRRLYPNRSGYDGTRRILSEPPPDIRALRGGVPPALANLLREMLAKKITRRPATALEVAVRLDAVLQELVVREGALTVSDYMNHHFAVARDRHRAALAERLRGRPAVYAEVPTERVPARSRARRWLRVCAAGAITLLAMAGLRSTGRSPPAEPPPVVAAVAAAPHPVEVVPLPPPAVQPPPPAKPPSPPRPHVERPERPHRPGGGKASHRNQRPGHRRVGR